MQTMRRSKLAIYVTIGIVACLGIVGIKLGLDYWQSRALDRLATRLGIGPSWISFENYLDQTFISGMDLDDALTEASHIGPYVAEPKSAGQGLTIVFDFDAMGFPPFISGRHKWIVIYYNDDRIVTEVYRFRPSEW